MQEYFFSPQIQTKWGTLLGELGVLDDEIAALETFKVTDKPSDDQKTQIRKCSDHIERIETVVGEMTHMMTEFTRTRMRDK